MELERNLSPTIQPSVDPGARIGSKRAVLPPVGVHPADGASKLGSMSLVALDSDMVGLAEMYLKAGSLTDAERTKLQDQHALAERLAEQLQDPARTFAGQLASLARSLLDATAHA